MGGQGGGGAVSGIVAFAEASGTSSSGPVTVEGAHVTIAGVRQPAYAESQSGLLSGAGGTAVIDLDRSIVHGTAPSKVVRVTTGGLGGPPSNASITIRRSDTTDTTGGDVTVTDSQNTQDALLFADPAKYDYHLRFGSPAIDKGGDQVPGESTTDIDGQPRGAKTDLGADEFINQPPVAKVVASSVTVRQGDPVTFDASGSHDPDIGGGIVKYLWDFGDGTTTSTTAPSVQHTYAAVGNYTVTLVAVDAANAAGSATTAVNVSDGTPPQVKIASPKDGQRLHIYTTTTTTKKVKDKATGKTKTVRVKHRGRRAIRLRGTASDASGVASVELSLRRVSISKGSTSSKKKSSSSSKKSSTRAKAAASKCVYLDPKNQKFVLRTCSRPKFFAVHQDNGLWSYKISDRLNIKPGLYELQARATDKAGVVSDPVVVRFRLL
jgi:PKD repeat protein